MFGMVLEKLYLLDLQKISGDVEQKICAVGVTNILTEAPAMLQNYEAFWSVNLFFAENFSVWFLYKFTYHQWSEQIKTCQSLITTLCHFL